MNTKNDSLSPQILGSESSFLPQNSSRRSFLKRSGGATAAAYLCWHSSSQRISAQEPVDPPSPDKNNTKEYIWGFVVTATPEQNDVHDVERVGNDAHWRSKEAYPFVSAELRYSGPDYKGKAYYDAYGSDLTPDPDPETGKDSVGVGSVKFGATLKIELLKKPPNQWDVIDTATCKLDPRTWTLGLLGDHTVLVLLSQM